MPSAISSYQYGNASYDMVNPTDRNTTEEPSANGDIVEISLTETPANPPGATGATYGPSAVSDRFRYDIDNGMFNRDLRFNALRSRFPGASDATYSSRANLGQQMTRAAGGGGAYAALFKVQHQDAQPSPAKASSHVDARSELNRMVDQNLSLLNDL